MSLFREQVVKRFRRSSGWSKVRAAHIKKYPRCAACNTKSDPEVHHIEDFSTYPEKELDPTNLITLCGNCHILFGHLKYWQSINPNVVEDTAWMLQKVRNRRS